MMNIHNYTVIKDISIDGSDIPRVVEGVRFVNCSFRRDMKDCRFNRCRFESCALSEMRISKTEFDSCYMVEVNFVYTTFINTSFINCDLSGAVFRENGINQLELINCNGILDFGAPHGYRVLSTVIDDEPRIFAGCRSFSIEEARRHWDPQHRGPGRERMPLIVDHVAMAHGGTSLGDVVPREKYQRVMQFVIGVRNLVDEFSEIK